MEQFKHILKARARKRNKLKLLAIVEQSKLHFNKGGNRSEFIKCRMKYC